MEIDVQTTLVGPGDIAVVTLLEQPLAIATTVMGGPPGAQGPAGPPGPQGPEGGTDIVSVPYDAWPPANPQPDTLYLRLAP